ncbi:SigE family RNA polymerase sigma factor [Kribbella sp. NBC_01245]|uniref:SigE family RNA polymerase sigma factor n=1 Tax=Kribbella sp. NBC_01245 TaxID=2903578 RepID=UPI002E2CF866|nr:SigE family RNA polymerase sigma factor [Kribbella sp. NBC_01245]
MKASEQADLRDYVIARKAALLRTAYLLSGDWHKAEDLVSMTVLKLYGSWRKVRAAAYPDAYVRRILVRVFLQEKRHPSRREHPTDLLPETASAPATTDLDHREDLRRLLDRMPPRQRAVLVLRYYDDLSIEQTAEVLGCSAGAVKSLTVRAIDSIRGLLPAGVTTRTDYEEAL